ncbi:hypothetical protein [Chryseobacterium sp. Leaf180]|uniref:hypothetical protein n=1 Tax=Chryseobacterium sp. Leaf180 TaxID=1736289 RepID=UPI001040C0CE|nr:hypothetical protein [Chryseobacterium sp. Leaf180]
MAWSQQSDNPYIYDEPHESTMRADGDAPAEPGDPPGNPIDSYIPLLMVAALGLAIAYGKARKTAQ